ALILATTLAWRPAWADADDQATAFIKRLSDRLTSVVNGPGNEADKRAQMRQIIDHDVLVNSINSHLGEYAGVRITLGRTVPGDDQATVSSTVERPNNPPTEVKWIVSLSSGGPKVVDVVAEGTSMRLTQRE